MSADALITEFRKKVCSEVELEAQGLDRYIVHTPFMFDDGDHFTIILKRQGDGWFLTDDGHTLMHLSYSDVDLETETRWRVIEDSLSAHGIDNVEGEFRLAVPDEEFGDALWSFLQGINGATSAALLTRERVQTAFMEDVKSLLSEKIPAARRIFHWNDPSDPEELYTVDCRIEAKRPWFIFGVTSDYKCRDVTISCLRYEREKIPFRSIAIFEDQTAISRKPLAQLSDVIGKQFSSLGDKARISSFITDEVLSS